MARRCASRRAGAGAGASRRCWPAARVGPNYARPQMPTPAAVPLRRERRAGAVAGRRAVVPGVRRSGAAGARSARRSPTTSTCRLAVGARRRGARPRRHRQVVPLPAGRRRAPATACARRRTRRRGRTTTTRRTRAATYGFQLSWEIDLFGRSGAQNEAALALRARERAGPPRRARHAGRRRRVQLLPAARARPAARHRAADARASTTRRSTYFQNRLDGGVSNRLELDRIQANRAQTAAAIPDIEQQIAHRRERDLAAARPAAGRRSRASALADGEAAAAADSARPAGVAARAAARRRAGGAAAGRGQRRHRRRQGAVLPDDQPDRISRRRQRRSHDVPRRRRRGLVARRRPAAADLPGRTAPPESRGDAGALRRGARRVPEGGAQRLPRGGQRAGDDSEAGRGARAAADRASTALQDAVRPGPRALRLRASPATSRS